MGYRSLVDSKLRQAFILLKDLATEAVFTKKTVTGFNFGTSDIVATPGDTVPAKVIITESVQKDNVLTKTLMVKSSVVGSLNDYTTVLLEGQVYQAGEAIKDSGYILILNVFREV